MLPIYEYICPQCGKVSELEWKNRNCIPEHIICTSCGERSPRKFSTVSFSFSPYLKEIGEGKLLNY